MYQDYKDVAAIYIVYIREAHAADSSWPVAYAKEMNITEHKSYSERCDVAKRLMKDKELNIPCLVDNMDGTVDSQYLGHPTRLYVVRKDGLLGVAAKRGPWGLKPALQEAQDWLMSFKSTGEEPPLPKTE